MNRFETFKDMHDKWRWRLIGSNNRVLVSSDDPFDSQVDALRAADAIKAEARSASVSNVPAMGPKEVIARLIEREEARRLTVDSERDVAVTPLKRRNRSRTRPGSRPRRLELVPSRRPA